MSMERQKEMRQMFRYEVKIDDKPQRYLIHGEVRKVATQPWVPGSVPVVEFWAEDINPAPGGTLFQRTFQVFGTGQPLPEDAQWRGTTDRDPSGFVWHLYEMVGKDDA
jgi:hypothetical protein